MPSSSHPSHRRYGCHESREDIELVISDRATPVVRELFTAHLQGCAHCRRMHRLLVAAYEGPAAPPPPSGTRQDKEFYTTLQRMRDERPEPWTSRWGMRAAVASLSTSAAILALSLFDFPSGLRFGDAPETPMMLTVREPSPDATNTRPMPHAAHEASGFRHAAQAYGRVVGGAATVIPPDGTGKPTSSNTFPVGTRFQLNPSETLQVALIGKMVANFTPSSDIEWLSASPSLVELQVNRGIASFRYDRDPSDPILQIRTPSALVRVVGTVFTVQVNDEEDTLVSVLRGQVDVLDPATNRLMAEVESGYRYDVAKATFDDVGKLEILAALPLSIEVDGGSEDPLALPSLRIPTSWNVPGLPADPQARILANVPSRPGSATSFVRASRSPTATSSPAAGMRVTTRSSETARVEDEGDDLIAELMRDTQALRRKELHAMLGACRDLYTSYETRYRAAKCFSNFLAKYDDEPGAHEAWALLGILRMDYALDYRAAEVALQTYLQRAPNGPLAEIAMYRMWLSSVEDGRISQALKRGRGYLERYPSGRFVGKILQRFPELKSEI